MAAAGIGFVDKLKVKCRDQSLAHAPICEFGLARVHHKPRDAAWALVGNDGFNDLPRLYGVKIVRIFPAFRVQLSKRGGFARFKGFKLHRSIGVKIQSDFIKVICTAPKPNILAPILRVAHEANIVAGVKIANDIRGTGNRDDIQARVLEICRLPLCFFQNWPQPHQECQLTILSRKGEFHPARPGLGECFDFLPKSMVARMANGAQCFI